MVLGMRMVIPPVLTAKTDDRFVVQHRQVGDSTIRTAFVLYVLVNSWAVGFAKRSTNTHEGEMIWFVRFVWFRGSFLSEAGKTRPDQTKAQLASAIS